MQNIILTILVYIIYSLTEDQKTMLKEMGGLADGLSSEEISSNIFNRQRLAENASRNNSTNVKPKTDKDGNIILNKYLVTDAKKDGDTNIYDQNGNKIGETLFDDTFIKYGSDNLPIEPAKDYTINFDINITELMDDKVKQANREMPWVVANKSKNKGEYDLKTKLGDYNGYVYDGKIITGRGAGNILFGRNIVNLSFGIDFILNKALKEADKYHYNRLNDKQKSRHDSSNPVRPKGETDEAFKYIDYGIKKQRDNNYDTLLKIRTKMFYYDK